MKAPTGAFPPNKSAGLSARSCVTFQVHEEQRIFRATRVERLRKEFEIMFSVVPTSTPSICVFRMGHNEVSRKRQLDSQRKAREEPN